MSESTNEKYGRKYLEDIGVKSSEYEFLDTVEDSEQLKEQREIYGFDVREVFDLDRTLDLIIYERLMMYREKATLCIDMDRHTLTFEGVEYTFGQLLDVTISEFRSRIENRAVMDTEGDKSRAYRALARISNLLWF